MESIPLRHAISATNQSFLVRRQSNPENQFQSSSQMFHLHTPTRRFRIHSKLSGFQDSKDYVKPSRLLPATEVKICTDNSVEKLFSAITISAFIQRIPSRVECRNRPCYRFKGSISELNCPKSGQWRSGSVSLTVICGLQSSLEEKDGNKLQYTGFSYNFEAEDTLMGEGSDTSMVQLRPYLVTKLSGVDPFTIFTKSLP
ncbi:hypothetical protein ACFX11_005617 [Malus domestica]